MVRDRFRRNDIWIFVALNGTNEPDLVKEVSRTVDLVSREQTFDLVKRDKVDLGGRAGLNNVVCDGREDEARDKRQDAVARGFDEAFHLCENVCPVLADRLEGKSACQLQEP